MRNPRALIVAVLASTALGLSVQQARADSPAACPSPAVAYEGEDPVVRELRLMRDELRATCLAARSDAEQAQAAAIVAHDDARDLVDAQPTGGESGPAPGSSEANPAHITVPDTVLDQAQDGFNAVHELLWFLAGLTVAALAAPHLRRMLTP